VGTIIATDETHNVGFRGTLGIATDVECDRLATADRKRFAVT